MDRSPKLRLPYILASQADKHVVVNEAFGRLDLMVQLRVRSQSLTLEPATPQDGDTYILPPGATGTAWATATRGQIARFSGGGWSFDTPSIGWLAYCEDEDCLVMYKASGWSQSNFRAALGLGEAARKTIGTSGNAVPTLDGTNTWSSSQVIQGNVSIENIQPALFLKDIDAQPNEKSWRLIASGPSILLQTLNDALAASTILQASRAGANISSVSFPFDGAFGFGTDNPASYGADLVLTRTKPGSQTIIKCINPSAQTASQARIDLATGVPNAYALFGLSNATPTAADFVFSGGTAVSSMNLYFNRFMFMTSTGTELMRLEPGIVRAGTDNVTTLGHPSVRWSTIYAATGAINTSDAREKTALEPIPDKVKRAIQAIRAQIGVFQWQDSIAAKGADQARLHVGVTAQMVQEAFLNEKLDPNRWALFCEDKVEETIVLKAAEFGEDGALIQPAKTQSKPILDADGRPLTRLGLRTDQLMWLMLGLGGDEKSSSLIINR